MNRNSKNVVRLTEEKLQSLIRESIHSVLNENSNNNRSSILFDSFLSQLQKMNDEMVKYSMLDYVSTNKSLHDIIHQIMDYTSKAYDGINKLKSLLLRSQSNGYQRQAQQSSQPVSNTQGRFIPHPQNNPQQNRVAQMSQQQQPNMNNQVNNRVNNQMQQNLALNAKMAQDIRNRVMRGQ